MEVKVELTLHKRAVKIYISVMNILTDLTLVVLPTIIVLPVQMPWGTRITILSAFWLRLMYASQITGLMLRTYV